MMRFLDREDQRHSCSQLLRVMEKWSDILSRDVARMLLFRTRCVPLPLPHPLTLFMALAVWKDCSLLGEKVKGAKDWKLSSKSTGDERRAETSQRERPVMTEAERERPVMTEAERDIGRS
jgi:hypothetical protein